MLYASEIAPLTASRLMGGAAGVPDVVDYVLCPDLFARRLPSVPMDIVEAGRVALKEVLRTVLDISGPQAADDESIVEVWVEPGLLIMCVNFRGDPLPEWLLANWDRGREPAILAPVSHTGWSWLLVREALDSVLYEKSGDRQFLFLERRL